jgi:hypothetical protein
LGIIEETASAHNIVFSQKANDQVKFEVFKLTLKDLFLTLGKNPSRDYLEKVSECFDILENGFYELINNGTIQSVDLNRILPIFIEANASLKSALRKDDDSTDFFKNQRLCRWKINEFNQHLR